MVRKTRTKLSADPKKNLDENGGGLASPPNAQTDKPPSATIIHQTVYLDRAVHRQLRLLAATLDVKMHAVLMEGLDAMFEKHGLPSIAEIKRQAKRG